MNAPVILQSFFLLPKSERVGVVLPPKTLKSNEWMAKWQEQEDGSEKFQHNSVSTKIGEEKR
jgi:hypothetical protein